MRLDLYGGIEPGAAVLHDDRGAGIRMLCPDTDMQRPGIRIHPMLNGVLHDGLQGERRQAELGIRSAESGKRPTTTWLMASTTIARNERRKNANLS